MEPGTSKWTLGDSNGAWEVQMEPDSISRHKLQQEQYPNVAWDSKWSVGESNGALDVQTECGTFAQAAQTLPKP